jgi:NADH-quinone oxidoreductase subunit I
VLGNLKGLLVTLATMFRPPVTYQYPKTRKPIEARFMGFPVLTWDEQVGEPYCTGCMVCVRYCPTQCMTAVMMNNPLQAEGKSSRRKIVESFEINLGRCILCRICVDVCNFDAIEMSHEHELSKYARNDNRTDLPGLLKMGWAYQRETGWKPAKEAKEVESVEAES